MEDSELTIYRGTKTTRPSLTITPLQQFRPQQVDKIEISQMPTSFETLA